MLVQKPYEQPTTGPNTTVPSFNRKQTKSNSSTIINLVESIVTENNALKQQIARIEAGLEKAGVLSKGLLRQNESLRSLYKQRTIDIGKLIKTISIQCDEEKVDYQHQCHLLQELNFAILKQIKNIDKQIKEANDRIFTRQLNVDQIGKVKYDLEHDSLNKIRARINNGISHESIAKAKKKFDQQQEQTHYLEKQINDLIVINTRIGGQIEKMKNTEGPARQVITNEKIEYQQRLNSLIQQNSRYIEQLNNDRSELEKVEAFAREKKEKYEQILENLNAEIRNYGNHNKKSSEFNYEIESLSNKIIQSQRQRDNNQNTLRQLRQNKNDLIQKIEAQKKKIYKLNADSLNKGETSNQQMRDHLKRLRKQIETNELNAKKQIDNIKKETEKVCELLSDKEFEESSLQEKITEYEKIIQEHPNPICEIERIELMMRLKKTK